TLLSIADVAIGSKTSINFGIGDSKDLPAPLNEKHTIGAYHNPTAVLIDKRYLDTLPPEEYKFGLVECLKHGLLQDSNLFATAGELLQAGSPDQERAYSAAIRTAELKSDTLELDPWEVGYGKLLLYGHLHAHAIERVTNMEVPHGTAVLLGI